MAAPIGGEIGESFETMRDAMVDLLLVGVCFVIRFADTFGDHLGIALAMAGIFAVGTLHPGSVLQKVTAKSTAHNIVELLRDELVSLLFVNIFLLLPNGTLAIETDIEWPSVLQLLGCETASAHSTESEQQSDPTKTHSQVNSANGLQSEPGVNHGRAAERSVMSTPVLRARSARMAAVHWVLGRGHRTARSLPARATRATIHLVGRYPARGI